jgi:hypothetical protein
MLNERIQRLVTRGKLLTETARSHPGIFWLGVLASIASIIALVGWWIDRNPGTREVVQHALQIQAVQVSARGPAWDASYSSADEIVLRINASNTPLPCGRCSNVTIIGFWRLANSYETNWHIAKRRDGSHYVLAEVPGEAAARGGWEAFFGGIECDKTYAGEISVLLMAYPQSFVSARAWDWLDDDNGWGFRDLPRDEALAISAPRVVNTQPVR